jgi:hypothetical protein
MNVQKSFVRVQMFFQKEHKCTDISQFTEKKGAVLVVE